MLIFLIIIYILCGFINYGATLGYFLGKFSDLYEDKEYKEEDSSGIKSLALLTCLGGFIMIGFVYLLSDKFKYGFRWKW